MGITVTMIEEKEFKTKMRGYDPQEVDEFLDEICDEMEQMQNDIVKLQSRLSQAGTNVFNQPTVNSIPSAAVPAPATIVEEKKSAQDFSEEAARMLRSAQKVYDNTVAEAKAEAERIINEAKGSVSEENQDLVKERETLENELKELRKTAQDYREKFAALVENLQSALEHAKELFD